MSTVKNLDRLLKKLDGIKNINLKPAMAKATAIVEASAKDLAPVDKGTLQGSIHPEVKGNKNTIIGRVYTSLGYAPYVEFGTGEQGDGSYPYEDEINGTLSYKEDWHGMVAQPYMYPALKQNENIVKDTLNDAVKKELKKHSKGGK